MNSDILEILRTESMSQLPPPMLEGYSLSINLSSKVIDSIALQLTYSMTSSSNLEDGDEPSCHEPNFIRRAIYEGCTISTACRVSSYGLRRCDSRRGQIINSESDYKWQCKIHGRGCMGHLEADPRMAVTLMPSSIIPNPSDATNAYQRLKNRVCEGLISHEQYRDLTSKIMMGKKGLIRSMCSIRVEGTMKAVISVGVNGMEGTIDVPDKICRSIKIPCIVDDRVETKRLNDGDWALLVRQPCLWSGSIQPVRIRVTDEDMVGTGDERWDVNWTIKLPPDMCAPYAADFDGDQMTIFPVKSQEAVDECNRFRWSYDNLSDIGLHQQLVPRLDRRDQYGFSNMCMRSTVCWTDRDTPKFKVTGAHKVCQLNNQAFMNIGKYYSSPLDFAKAAISSMNLGASKSSLQSDVGALCRRSRLGAERIFISSSGCMAYMRYSSSTPIQPQILNMNLINKSMFGNPCVRAVSKIASRLMQITLKVKSTQSLGSGSPSMTFLSGDEPWPVILVSGATSTQDSNNYTKDDIESTPSIWHISQCSADRRKELSINCIIMCVSETGVSLDGAEFEALYCLCYYLANQDTSKGRGIAVLTFESDASMPTIWRWSSCYYDGDKAGLCKIPRIPESCIERRMLSNFDSLPSIRHEFGNSSSLF
ncbi:RNA polymerase Rpb1, domain 2 [Nitzschia inconspicua]|uniref:DNA-directed RNA polymerase n=1 Tax=Nitzschia inconspicua TaxID=303405 RepID=A0A9K3LAD1_9STRA|nr:RNA polymerase Rpb1, domain 2 [Nitzschia inconspicua]